MHFVRKANPRMYKKYKILPTLLTKYKKSVGFTFCTSPPQWLDPTPPSFYKNTLCGHVDILYINYLCSILRNADRQTDRQTVYFSKITQSDTKNIHHLNTYKLHKI